MLEDLPEEVLHTRASLSPGLHLEPWLPPLPALPPAHPRADEVADLTSLLQEHAAPGTPQAFSEHIALACLGANHLWQDLGLPSREALGALMRQHYPALVTANVEGMRWKKFFYRELCKREEVLICRSPSCAVCTERGVCFAPVD